MLIVILVAQLQMDDVCNFLQFHRCLYMKQDDSEGAWILVLQDSSDTGKEILITNRWLTVQCFVIVIPLFQLIDTRIFRSFAS